MNQPPPSTPPPPNSGGGQAAPPAPAHVTPVSQTATVAPAPTLATPPFPSPSPNPFTGDATTQQKLQSNLDAAIASGPGTSWRTPVCIAALPNADGTGSACVVASFRPNENHYTASLAKLCAMYAAFELRETMRAIAAELGANATPTNFIAQAQTYLNPLILAKAGPILAQATLDPHSKAAVSASNKVPSYDTMFTVTAAGSGVAVNFSPGYLGNLQQMISVSSDPDSEACIHGVGYGYLIGALASAGFFDTTTKTGLWLCGDYSFFQHWGALTIDTVNDAKASAVATVSQLVKFLTLLFLSGGLLYTGSVKDAPDASNPQGTAMGRARAGMLALFQSAGSWLTDASFAPSFPLTFSVVGAKVGRGPLKQGSEVFSEAEILQHKATGRRFATAWQNFVKGSDGFDPIAHVLQNTIEAFLAP
jgi:hypothetical protein